MNRKRIWFKATNIWQIKHEGETGFVWKNFETGRSIGTGLPANEVELVANWNVTYRTFFQVIAVKIRRLFA
jgi:hypothetical protein